MHVQESGKDSLLQFCADSPADSLFMSLQNLEDGVRRVDRYCHLFYSPEGSDVFDRIIDEPDYYLYRTELGILQDHSGAITELSGSRNLDIIDLGAGKRVEKAAALVGAAQAAKKQVTYSAVDVNAVSARENARALQALMGMGEDDCFGCASTYEDAFDHIRHIPRAEGDRLVTLLGSNIGNFTEAGDDLFLRRMRKVLSPGDYFLIGFDILKDVQTMVAAYSGDLTARFNYLFMHQINDLLHADFIPENFQHEAVWNERKNRMESHLVSLYNPTIQPIDRAPIKFFRGDRIHTENSIKYTLEQIAQLASSTGFELVENFSDEKGWFVDSLWRVPAD